ncbi:hypothetical protein [Flammeovirga sp. SJP92]|uniref:hypothetical protein n=1 Tax=Flammeovirga sp. SJP92 TaxID=1775430 RepID=UPI000787956B|nr:hypothetical protein [Flammeovirga sp. SJP92]KXX67403.1 hypothetical protein AVL50_26905 [Flammeovirga sp. SJP92]
MKIIITIITISAIVYYFHRKLTRGKVRKEYNSSHEAINILDTMLKDMLPTAPEDLQNFYHDYWAKTFVSYKTCVDRGDSLEKLTEFNRMIARHLGEMIEMFAYDKELTQAHNKMLNNVINNQ